MKCPDLVKAAGLRCRRVAGLLATALATIAFATSVAHAQATVEPTPDNPCGIATPPGVKVWYQDAVSNAKPFQCASSVLGGTGTAPSWRSNDYGQMLYWYCPAPDRWAPMWAAATNEWLTVSTVAADLVSIATSADKLLALNVVMKKNAGLPLSDPSLARVWCPFQQEMFDGRPVTYVPPPPPPPPPAITYRVAKFGLATTRPGYPMTCAADAGGGAFTCTRSTVSNQRAAVGAPCDCSRQALEGSSRYCAFNPPSAPPAAALCEAVPTP